MAGIFERYPNLKIVTHHHGGMIPFFTERFLIQAHNFNEEEVIQKLKYLHKFYCDTATFGVQPINIFAALTFFGPDRVLFGTDTPMDMGEEGFFTRTSLQSLDELEVYIRHVNLKIFTEDPSKESKKLQGAPSNDIIGTCNKMENIEKDVNISSQMGSSAKDPGAIKMKKNLLTNSNFDCKGESKEVTRSKPNIFSVDYDLTPYRNNFHSLKEKILYKNFEKLIQRRKEGAFTEENSTIEDEQKSKISNEYKTTSALGDHRTKDEGDEPEFPREKRQRIK